MTRFATLTFARDVAAPVETLWQAWTAPAARALWSAPTPAVTVEVLEAETRVGGREVTLCHVAGEPDIRCELGWLELAPPGRSVNYEVISCEGETRSSALVTAGMAAVGEGSRLELTVQLSDRGTGMEQGYREGFGAAMGNLAEMAGRMMVITRFIPAPRAVVWGAWMDADSLPQWWGPDGFTCRTARIDLREGGEWVFDMIGPDGTVYPNHHRYHDIRPNERLAYTLLWGENGPKHADAWASLDEVEGGTTVTLAMAMATVEELRTAKGFGAEALGLQTLGKLARFAGAA